MDDTYFRMVYTKSMIYKASDLFYALTSNYLLIVDGNTVDDLIELMENYPNQVDNTLWDGAELILEGDYSTQEG